jgi:hypothetical protein
VAEVAARAFRRSREKAPDDADLPERDGLMPLLAPLAGHMAAEAVK